MVANHGILNCFNIPLRMSVIGKKAFLKAKLHIAAKRIYAKYSSREMLDARWIPFDIYTG